MGSLMWAGVRQGLTPHSFTLRPPDNISTVARGAIGC